MIRFLITFCLILMLSSCSFFHVRKQTIEQGNLFTSAAVNQLHTGMSTAEVIDLMGHPVLINTFKPNELIYVYTYDNHKTTPIQKRVICRFVNGQLVSVSQS